MSSLEPFDIPLSGNQLIEAGAGTGKTYTLASLFLRLVLAGHPVREILVVTFTEAATAELKERLRSRLRDAQAAFRRGNGGSDRFLSRMLQEVPLKEHTGAERFLQSALAGFDEAAVFTIHGFCLRALQENAFESGVLFDMELSPDPEASYRDIAVDYWALGTYDLPEPWVRLLKEKKISVDTLTRLLRLTAGHPDRRVLPEPKDLSVNMELFQDLYRQTRTLWKRQREKIKELLETHDGVNRRSYSKKTLPLWIAGVDSYLEKEDPTTLPGEGNLEKFTQTRLTEKSANAKDSGNPPRHPFFELCDRLAGFGDAWAVQFQRRFIDFGREGLAKRKADLGLRFFDDLIQDLAGGLGGPGGENLARQIRARYPTAMIDEFQDTDLTQYRIFRDIYQAGNLPLIMIGDPKQSIYAFRGADIFAYLQASGDAGDAVHTLGVNFRSDPSLICAVNTLFDPKRTARPFGPVDIDFHPAVPREGARDSLILGGKKALGFRFLYVRPEEDGDETGGIISKEWAERHLPGMVAADILKLLSEGELLRDDTIHPVTPGDIAVLVRSNRQGRLMQDAFRKAGIPNVLISPDSVFESFEATELWHVLSAAAAPSKSTLLFTALATDFLGVSGEEIDAFRTGEDEWDWWVAAFREWRRIWQDAGFVQMITQVFNETAPGEDHSFLTRLLSLTDGERRVTNFQHLAELLQGAAAAGHLGPDGLLRWFQRQRSGNGDASDAVQLRLESDARAVRIVTVHKSKGLEYPVVYLPYLWDGSLHTVRKAPAECHLPDSEYRPVIDLGSDRLSDHLELAFREQMSENLRLLYVALTRAKHACRVVWGRLKDAETSALGYLLHRPEENPDADFTAIASHIKTLDDGRIRDDLRRLVNLSGGGMEIRDLAPESGERYVPPDVVPRALSRRFPDRIPGAQWRIESFSRLVAEGARRTTPEEEAGLDHDQRARGGPERRPVLEADHSGIVPLAVFPKGADAGTFFHAIYEDLDFTGTDSRVTEKLVAEKLTAYGFDAACWRETVTRAIGETLECPLDPDLPGLTLGRIPTARRLNELAFMFPAADGEDAATTPVAPGRLRRLFETYPSPSVPADYGQRIGVLRFPAIRGFLKGFMDLVFGYEGRWYLADYKSNHLGDRFADYDAAALSREMADHHYYLQYHLYLAALHRYLAYRLPDYDYDTHFGGVYYLFIRGMSKETGHRFGVFRDRPEKVMVEELSRAFGC